MRVNDRTILLCTAGLFIGITVLLYFILKSDLYRNGFCLEIDTYKPVINKCNETIRQRPGN